MAQESSGGWQANARMLAEIREWSDTLGKAARIFQCSSWGRTAYETNPAGLSENLTQLFQRVTEIHVAWRLGLTCSKTLAFSLHTGRAKGS